MFAGLPGKDFIGETLDLPVHERLIGTFATTAVCAWLGARIYRVHEVLQTRQVLDTVSSIQGTRPPSVVLRGVVPERSS